MTLPKSLMHSDIIQMNEITKKKELSWKRVESLPAGGGLRPSHSRVSFIESS